MTESGTLDKSYHVRRNTKKSLIYRLNRRTNEVIHSIRKHFSGKPSIILDLGTADALMLSKINKTFLSAYCIGIELSRELIETNTDNGISLLQGNVSYLPISSNTVDIVIATAVIEHLHDTKSFLDEVIRVLKNNGIVILTSPDPFWEHIATMIGHLRKEQHFNVMSLTDLVPLFQRSGYKIVEQKKFMLSPVGMPFELPIENIVRLIGLDFLFANQLLVGKKQVSPFLSSPMKESI